MGEKELRFSKIRVSRIAFFYGHLEKFTEDFFSCKKPVRHGLRI